MLLSLGLVFLLGLSLASIFEKLKLPRIIGMLLCGIVMGPYAIDLLNPALLGISAELRQIALIIILVKAGLSLNIKDLLAVGRPALLMSFLPATFEVFAYFLLAPVFFKLNWSESLLMGAVLAAVSPAIVVPRMVNLIEEKYGTKERIPQLILAGASCDDVFVIVLFSTFSTMVAGGHFTANSLLGIPISIVSGVVFGCLLGLLLHMFFGFYQRKNKPIRNSVKVIIILSVSFLTFSLEDAISIPFSGLLAIISMACAYKVKASISTSTALSQKFGKLWIAAELILFVLVGATVDISYLLKSTLPALAMVLCGLVIRSIGVWLSVLGTSFNRKERLFCILAYIPKATVQAAIGAVPLSLGFDCGSVILTVAVFSIIVTAPLGAIAIDKSYKKLLAKEE